MDDVVRYVLIGKQIDIDAAVKALSAAPIKGIIGHYDEPPEVYFNRGVVYALGDKLTLEEITFCRHTAQLYKLEPSKE